MYNFELIFMGGTHTDARGLSWFRASQRSDGWCSQLHKWNETRFWAFGINSESSGKHLYDCNMLSKNWCERKNFSLNYVTKFMHSFVYLLRVVNSSQKFFYRSYTAVVDMVVVVFIFILNQIKLKPCLYTSDVMNLGSNLRLESAEWKWFKTIRSLYIGWWTEYQVAWGSKDKASLRIHFWENHDTRESFKAWR